MDLSIDFLPLKFEFYVGVNLEALHLFARTDDLASCSGGGFIAFTPSAAVEVSREYPTPRTSGA
jgi:hypothetical protein